MLTQSLNQAETDPEPFLGLPRIIKSGTSKLSIDEFKRVFAKRRVMLESIQELVSIKFYQGLEIRLKQEEEAALELTNSNYLDNKRQSRYTHVLDAQYFEQKFL